MFEIGNKILQNISIHSLRERPNPILPEDATTYRYHISPIWPIEIEKHAWLNRQELSQYPYFDQEKLGRIQVLLRWMIWKYTLVENEYPHGFCQKKLQDDIHEIFYNLLEQFWISFQKESKHSIMNLDYQLLHIIVMYII